jgi:hypothetical protein
MSSTEVRNRWLLRIGGGFVAGAAIVAVDNLAFGGEVSPIVIVAMLLAATAAAGAIWGRRGWVAAAATWVCVPGAHLIKHLLGLPDTLHPNTYTSILMLALFSLAVSAIGIGCGMLVRQLRTRAENDGSPPA